MAYTNGSGKAPEPERKTNITSLEEVRKRAEAEAKASIKASQPSVPLRDRLIGLGFIGIAVATVGAWIASLTGFGAGR
jgi:CCR4-NOT transcriptional regulation complex NOT5 subunit